jgi:hypothetical protein
MARGLASGSTQKVRRVLAFVSDREDEMKEFAAEEERKERRERKEQREWWRR